MQSIYALILFALPPGTPVEATEEQWPTIRNSVQRLALQIEILDPRETSYIMAKRSEFETDINLLRRRYREFADVPRVAESHRLPERQAVNELIVFNRAYRRHLMERHILERDRAEVFLDAVRETDRLYKVWDAVRDARCEFYYITVRRHALKKLKDMIGEESYLAGEMPDPVPVWRFNELPR